MLYFFIRIALMLVVVVGWANSEET